jgi:hypothetical protein
MGSEMNTYGNLAAKDTMITDLCAIGICRPQIKAMEKVNNKISVEISSAVIACQRGNLSLLADGIHVIFGSPEFLAGSWLFWT